MKLKLRISIILLCILLLVAFEINNKIEYYNHSNMLDSIVYDGKTNLTKYIGYIEIERLGLKRGIVNGINDLILNSNDVGMTKKNNNIILAGHSIENVFGKLHSIKIDDKIKLNLYGNETYYIVKDINVVDKTDTNSLTSELNLITCMFNPDKRLVIGAQKNI